jgi:hypothetical protein
MHDAQKNLAGLVVFLGNIVLDDLTEWNVTGLVSLYDVSGSFVYYDQVIVLIEHLQIGL